MEYCLHNHEIRSSADRTKEGRCRKCHNGHLSRQRQRASAALKIVDALSKGREIPEDAINRWKGE